MPNDFEFEIAGTRFKINDLCSSLNNDFLSYHQSVFGFPVFNVNQFKETSKSYFTSVRKDTRRWEKHDFYFGNFTIIWRTLLDQGKFRFNDKPKRRQINVRISAKRLSYSSSIFVGTMKLQCS